MSEFNVKGTSSTQRQKETEEAHGHQDAEGHEASSTGSQDHARVQHHHHHHREHDDKGSNDSRFHGRVDGHEQHNYANGAAEATTAAASSKYGEGYEGLEGGHEVREARQVVSKTASNTGWRTDGATADATADAKASAKADHEATTDNAAGYKMPTFDASKRVKDGMKHPEVQAAGKDFHNKVAAGDKGATEVVNGLASGESAAMTHAQGYIRQNYAKAAEQTKSTSTTTTTSSAPQAGGKSISNASRLSQHEANHQARVEEQKAGNKRIAAAMTSDGTDEMANKQKQSKGSKAAGKGGSKAASGGGASGAGGKGEAGAASGSGATGGGGGDAGMDGLSGMELVQAVMLLAAQEASKSAQDLAKQVQGNTARKNALRSEMEPMRTKVAGQSATNADGTSNTAAQTDKAALDNKQDQMDAIGDDNQILFIKLQNATQQYSSMLQGCSNVSKTLFDIDKAVIGNIGH